MYGIILVLLAYNDVHAALLCVHIHIQEHPSFKIESQRIALKFPLSHFAFTHSTRLAALSSLLTPNPPKTQLIGANKKTKIKLTDDLIKF